MRERTLLLLLLSGTCCVQPAAMDAGYDEGARRDVFNRDPADHQEVISLPDADAPDAALDAANGDIPPLPDPPWSGGAIRGMYLPRVHPVVIPRVDCGVGCRRLDTQIALRDPNSLCLFGETLYAGGGAVVRIRLGGGVPELLSLGPEVDISGTACSENSLVVSVVHWNGEISVSLAIARLSDNSASLNILWSSPSIRRTENLALHSPWHLSASAGLIAFEMQLPTRPLGLWALLESSRELIEVEPVYPSPVPTTNGTAVVYSRPQDLWAWDPATRARRNLTNTPNSDDWDPWIDGNRVVYVSTDDGAGHRWEPNNPEIYLLDLSTGTRTRITNDPPDRPAVQLFPTLGGDWIVWADWRNAPIRNLTIDSSGNEIWGYHIPTRTLQRLFWARHTIPGNLILFYPRVLGGKLYVYGLETYQLERPYQVSVLYEQTLPTP